MTIQELHEKALNAAKKFKQAESDLVEIFQELDLVKAFMKLGYASLFEYGVKALGLSEANTYAFIQVARAAREVPALKTAIQSGLLTVSKAKRIAPVITPENQNDWLAKAQTLSKAGLEKEIARANPGFAVTERSRYVTAERLELMLGVSEDLFEKLKRVQDLVSQKAQNAASLEAALAEMAELYLEKNDPERKATRARFRIILAESEKGSSGSETLSEVLQQGPGPVPTLVSIPNSSSNRGLVSNSSSGSIPNSGSSRKRIPNATRHALNVRDQGRCTHIADDGTRCGQRRWIQIHHRTPVARGGTNDLNNLETLCFRHHQFEHEGVKTS
jgi:hypothetical protein